MPGPGSSRRGRNDGKRGLAQGWIPLREQERRLLRYEGRVQVRAQVQHQKGTLFRLDERGPMRYQVMGPERHLLLRPERLPFPALWRLQDRGPFGGQGFPQPSRGRESAKTKSEAKGQEARRKTSEVLGGRKLGWRAAHGDKRKAHTGCYVLRLWFLQYR
jgi:hypothetical protein